jgi:hypothetical protein
MGQPGFDMARRVSFSALIRVLFPTLVVVVAPDTATAQGSTGGTLGKADQSLSGGRPKVQKREQSTTASPCRGIVGSWAFNNGIDVVIRQGGTASATNGDVATWSCQGGIAVVAWKQWTDRYTVSSDGTSLSGISGFLGMSLSARRK